MKQFHQCEYGTEHAGMDGFFECTNEATEKYTHESLTEPVHLCKEHYQAFADD